MQALWALYVSGGFTESFGRELLGHRQRACPPLGRPTAGRRSARRSRRPPVDSPLVAARSRAWSVRSQLACTARARLPATVACRSCGRSRRGTTTRDDPHIPLLLWWAVERHAIAAREEVTELLRLTGRAGRRSCAERSGCRDWFAAMRPRDGPDRTNRAYASLLRPADDRQRAMLGARSSWDFATVPRSEVRCRTGSRPCREFGGRSPESHARG